MQKSMQSTLLNAQVGKGFFVRYSAAAAPCHSFPKAQSHLLDMKKADIFYDRFPGVTTLLCLFLLLSHIVQTCLEHTSSHCRKGLESLPQFLLVLRKLFSSEFYDLVFKV